MVINVNIKNINNHNCFINIKTSCQISASRFDPTALEHHTTPYCQMCDILSLKISNLMNRIKN